MINKNIDYEDELRKLSYDFSNNIKHKYAVMSHDLDLSAFILNREAFTITDNLEVNEKFTPEQIQIQFSFTRDMLAENMFDLSEQTFFNYFVKDIKFTEAFLENWIFNRPFWLVDIPIKEFFLIGQSFDIMGQINHMPYQVFSGTITEAQFSKTNTSFDVKVTVKSKMKDSYNVKFTEDKTLTDWFIYNSTQKEISLLHRWATMLGYTEYEIPDIKYPDGTYITIPYASELKDNNIINEVAEMVRSFNGTMRVDFDKLRIAKHTGVPFPTNYICNENNILQPFNSTHIMPTYKEVKVTFDKYYYGSPKTVWAAVGENGTVSMANILVKKGTNAENNKVRYVIEWVPSGLVKDWKLAEVKAFKVIPGTKDPVYVDLEYEFIDINNLGGYVKFYNTKHDTDIIIEKFIIEGTPVLKNSNNTLTFNKNNPEKVLDSEILTKSNKYVQTMKHAELYSQLMYHYYCEPQWQYEFGLNHCLSFLHAGCNCLIRHPLLDEMDLIINNFTHGGNTAKVKCTTYKPFEFVLIEGDELIDSGLTENDINIDKIGDTGILSPDKPNPPLDFDVSASLNAFVVKVTPPDDKIIKGFNCYYKRTDDTTMYKQYFGATQFVVDAIALKTYEVKITSVSFKDVESDFTTTKYVVPRQLNSDEVIYPPGQSPEELDEARKLLQQQLQEDMKEMNNGLTTKIEKNASDIVQTNKNITTTVSASITDLKENYLKNEFTRIDQKANQIELVAQRAEGKVDDLSDPTNLVAKINIAPEGVTITGNVIKLGSSMKINSDGSVDVGRISANELIIGDNFYADATTGALMIKKVSIGEVIGLNNQLTSMTNATNEIANKIANGTLVLNANTAVYGALSVYGGSYGIISYNGASEAASTLRTVLMGGALLYQEKY